jgi:hypothetical protein
MPAEIKLLRWFHIGLLLEPVTNFRHVHNRSHVMLLLITSMFHTKEIRQITQEEDRGQRFQNNSKIKVSLFTIWVRRSNKTKTELDLYPFSTIHGGVVKTKLLVRNGVMAWCSWPLLSGTTLQVGGIKAAASIHTVSVSEVTDTDTETSTCSSWWVLVPETYLAIEYQINKS